MSNTTKQNPDINSDHQQTLDQGGFAYAPED